MGDTDSPPPLDSVEELDDYWTENTTITVSRYTKARLDEHREGRPWDSFLEQLRREHADPITFNDVAEIGDYLAAELHKDVSVDADAVAAKIDYAYIASRVAEDVVGELR